MRVRARSRDRAHVEALLEQHGSARVARLGNLLEQRSLFAFPVIPQAFEHQLDPALCPDEALLRLKEHLEMLRSGVRAAGPSQLQASRRRERAALRAGCLVVAPSAVPELDAPVRRPTVHQSPPLRRAECTTTRE